MATTARSPGVGRQRADRRRQRHHQVAARAGRREPARAVGTFGRDAAGVERSNGSLFSISGSHAAAPSERLAYKVTAGFSTQNALGRPSGLIPNGTGTPYPDYENSGTSQPKFDVRVDYDAPTRRRSWCSPAASPAPRG